MFLVAKIQNFFEILSMWRVFSDELSFKYLHFLQSLLTLFW